MRFVAVKSEAQQTRATLFRTLGLLGCQRIQLTNASRGHLAEHGTVSPKEAANLRRLIHVTRYENDDLPGAVRELGTLFIEQIAALAVETLAPPMETSRGSRDCAAWFRLGPNQRSRETESGLRDPRRWAHATHSNF